MNLHLSKVLYNGEQFFYFDWFIVFFLSKDLWTLWFNHISIDENDVLSKTVNTAWIFFKW